jgi:aldose 1-epimerase
MSGSVVVRTTQAGLQVFELIDHCSQSRACVIPACGFNLFDLRLPLGGEIVPIIAAAANWEENPTNPTRNGMPLLFPFPNRIRDACFHFADQDFELVANKAPHAIHGFAFDAPFDVADFGVTVEGAFLTGRFQLSKHARQSATAWPTDCVLEVTYHLRGSTLRLEAEIRSPGPGVLPWGFGVHSYFRLPGRSETTRLLVPANQRWILENQIPNGEQAPVEGQLDFRKGRVCEGLSLDDLLTGLIPEVDGWSTCALIDEETGRQLRLRMGPDFREVVLFTPPWFSSVIAIEPYTQATDAIHLQPLGIDAGLRELAPGESARLAFEVGTVG